MIQEIATLLLVLALAATAIYGGLTLLYRLLSGRTAAQSSQRLGEREQLCIHCGYVGTAKMLTDGDRTVEFFLWLCGLLPGLIYTLRRYRNRYPVCPECGARNLIGPNSPYAQKLLQREVDGGGR